VKERAVKSPTLEQLAAVWRKILDAPDAKRALAKLKEDGLAIDHLKPRDPTLKQPCWADYLAAC